MRLCQLVDLDWGHIRYVNRIILGHFLCINDSVMGTGLDMSMNLFLFTHADRSNQRTDTDTGSTKIADFINFKAGIKSAGTG